MNYFHQLHSFFFFPFLEAAKIFTAARSSIRQRANNQSLNQRILLRNLWRMLPVGELFSFVRALAKRVAWLHEIDVNPLREIKATQAENIAWFRPKNICSVLVMTLFISHLDFKFICFLINKRQGALKAECIKISSFCFTAPKDSEFSLTNRNVMETKSVFILIRKRIGELRAEEHSQCIKC